MDKVADLDIATIMSMGFPAYRGGLMHWGDTYGAKYIVKRLNQFAAMIPQHAVRSPALCPHTLQEIADILQVYWGLCGLPGGGGRGQQGTLVGWGKGVQTPIKRGY